LHAHVGQYTGGNALTLTHQTEKEMLCTDVGMIETLRLFLSQGEDFSRSFCELVEIACQSRLS
jgi:hypothetical protein